MVGRGQPFVQHALQHRGQALAAIVRRGAQRGPTCLPKRLVRVFETRWHGDLTGFELRAHLIAHRVERCDLFCNEFARFVKHLGHQVGVDF